ncbi:MAG: murE [Frankiales bacterium]|nr:murE [Frankiales bacterium]
MPTEQQGQHPETSRRSLAWTTVTAQGRNRDVEPLPIRPHRVKPVALSRLAAVAAHIGARLIGVDRTVTGVSVASSLINPGDLFAALPGSAGHGAAHLDEAVSRGAVAVLTDRAGLDLLAVDRASGSATDLPAVLVEDPRAVLGAISAEVYDHPSHRLNVIGITGTSGKTTTSFLVRAGLRAAGRATGLIGTVGVYVGDRSVKTPFTTPEAPQLQALLAVMADDGVAEVAMEVSSHALRMGRVGGIDFGVAAFTNLSQDHLDFHHDMADYFEAKAILFDGRARRELIVIDDEWGLRLAKRCRPGRVTVSTTGPADWSVRDVRTLPGGSTTFTVQSPAGEFEAGCAIPGRYNVTNTLLALAILHHVGIEPTTVAAAVADAGVRGRMERVLAGQEFLAVVDYSHKPAGVAGALQALRPLTAGRLIIVLGCGGDRDRAKRPMMGEVAAREADVLIVTDDNPRSEQAADIRAAMLAGVTAVPIADRAEVFEIGDRRAAIERAVTLAGPGDTVLVAGKGHESGQEVAGVMLPFDDVEVVRESIGATGNGVMAP